MLSNLHDVMSIKEARSMIAPPLIMAVAWLSEKLQRNCVREWYSEEGVGVVIGRGRGREIF